MKYLNHFLEADRRDDLTKIDINNSSDLPTETAIGINWDIENDKLGFKVKFGNKIYTRRRTLSIIAKIYDPLDHLCCWNKKGFSKSYAGTILAGISKYMQRQWKNGSSRKMISNYLKISIWMDVSSRYDLEYW